MSPDKFIEELQKEDSTDYGLCPPPVEAQRGLQVLIDHFLGEDWYVTMPLSTEQVNTEAIYSILEKSQRNPFRFLSGLFTRKKRRPR